MTAYVREGRGNIDDADMQRLGEQFAKLL